jgi:hypothetical protein
MRGVRGPTSRAALHFRRAEFFMISSDPLQRATVVTYSVASTDLLLAVANNHDVPLLQLREHALEMSVTLSSN